MTRYRHLITDENRKWWTLGAMCFALFMIMLDNTVVNVALPSIQRDLGTTSRASSGRSTATRSPSPSCSSTGGRLGDIFGRRRMFLVGVVVFALSSATAGLAPDTTSLVASRVVQGVGARADDAGDAVDHHQRVPAARARQGDRHLGRRLGAGARDRPGARRLPHRARLLAGDLLHQPPGRRRRGRSRRCSRCASRATRRSGARSTSPASPTLTAGAHRARPRADRGQLLGLGLARDRRPARRLASSCWPPSSLDRAAGRARRWSSSACSRAATSSARTWSPSSSPSRCSGSSSSSPSTCRTSSATRRSRPGVRFLPATLMIVVDRAARRPAHRPDRAALADRRRTRAGRGRAVLADRASTSTTTYARPAARRSS